MSNKYVLDKGFEEGLKMIEQSIASSLHWAAVELVHRALINRGYTGFTGNTQTSYTCGIYLNGNLIEVVDSASLQERPVRRKIGFGSNVYLDNPYEGSPRLRHGYVKVNQSLYGSDTALKFINSYKAPKKGLALVMTTGTEYSEFLEQMFNLDVLTRTFKEAAKVLDRNWKSIP